MLVEIVKYKLDEGTTLIWLVLCYIPGADTEHGKCSVDYLLNDWNV